MPDWKRGKLVRTLGSGRGCAAAAKFGEITRARSRPGALSQGNAPGNKGWNAGAAQM